MALGNTQSLYSQRTGGMPRTRAWKYNGWERGENSFAEDNEIRDNEFYDGQDIELTGKSSIRLPRRGRRLFTSIPGATNFNGWGVYKDPITDINRMLAMFDGHMYNINPSGVPTEIDAGVTWDETAKMRGVLLRGFFYFGNGVDYMSKTDGSAITQWIGISAVTFSSLVLTGTGSDTAYDYAVTAVTDVGETETSAVLSAFGPGTLDTSNYFTLTWVRKTESNVKGYNVYKAEKGGTLTLLTFIDQPSAGANVTYADKGVEVRSLIYEVPTFNTTGGVKGNIYGKYANTLFVSGNVEEPDTVFYGGTGSNWESFSPSDNGGWVKPGRGDGDKVTALIGFEDFLLIYKENSVWKFIFASDGGPSLVSVIPQYGTSSPDTVWRMEKDIVFLGTDGRYRILGYEPTQLNVIRVTDISNRVQPKLDVLDKTNMDDFFATFFEQKFIVCNGSKAFPYDRRYLAFLGTWNNQNFSRFLIWDKDTGQQMLFAAQTGTGKIYQVLVDGTYDDDGETINGSIRPKRIDGGEDTVLKFFTVHTFKLKNPRGKISVTTYRDGASLIDTVPISFQQVGGIDSFMFDEAMFDEGVGAIEVIDSVQLVDKEMYLEAYSVYHTISVAGNSENHCILQTMSGYYEYEDPDYTRDENTI